MKINSDSIIILVSFGIFLLTLIVWYFLNKKNHNIFRKYTSPKIERSQNPKKYFHNILKRMVEISQEYHQICKKFLYPAIFFVIALGFVIVTDDYIHQFSPGNSDNIQAVLLGLIIIMLGILAPLYYHFAALRAENNDLKKRVRKLFNQYADESDKNDTSVQSNTMGMIERLHEKLICE